jgi:hypothetical protein
MAGITLEQAETQLAAWLAASEAVAQGQSYTISTDSGSRSLTRANAQEILRQVGFWDAQVKKLARGGIRIRGATITNG